MEPKDEIKQKINIVDLVNSYVSIKKSGRNYKGICPFHSEKSPSFMVSPELQIFKCFGCNEAGDIFSFVEKIEGVDFPAALEILAEKANVQLKKRENYDSEKKSRKGIIFEINHLALEYYHFILTKHKIGANALDYVKNKRKLSAETIEKFKIGYAPDSWTSLYDFLTRKKYGVNDLISAGVVIAGNKPGNYIDKFKGRVIFPMTDISGKIVGFMGRTIFGRDPKYLNTSDTEVFQKGTFLYSLDRAKVNIKKEGAVFVEGPMDVISASQAGVENVVASLGTSLTTGQLKVVSRYTKDIIFCFDSDTAGMTAISRAIELAEAGEFNISVSVIPSEHKDLDELAIAKPKEVKELFSKPMPIYDFFLISALKKYDKKSPIGKNKIIGELSAIFIRVKNPVILDHYTKKVAETLDLSEDVVAQAFKRGESEYNESSETGSVESSTIFKTKSVQEYMLALLLKAPLDTAQTLLYKLGQKDFTNPQFEAIFTELKEHLSGRKKKFDIKYFSQKFSKELKQVIDELYLWDFGTLDDNLILFEKEAGEILIRLKMDTTKRDLKDMSGKIKDAEEQKDTNLVKELTEKFSKLSEKLK